MHRSSLPEAWPILCCWTRVRLPRTAAPSILQLRAGRSTGYLAHTVVGSVLGRHAEFVIGQPSDGVEDNAVLLKWIAEVY